ncbi:MAG TPA: carboxypeptidase regulatory-like domain-containing protein [Gemmatimonadales bacterium]
MWGTLALLLVCGSHAAAQAYGAIEGRVLDSAGAPVVGALVSLDNTPFSVTSDAAGVFRLRGLTPGAHQLRIRRLGYEETTQAVTVESGVVARVELRIERAAVGVRGVTVIGSREELAELCAELRLVPGSVQLIEPEELRATRQANFNDVLRFTPGVFVQPRFGAADESQLSIRGSGSGTTFICAASTCW